MVAIDVPLLKIKESNFATFAVEDKKKKFLYGEWENMV